MALVELIYCIVSLSTAFFCTIIKLYYLFLINLLYFSGCWQKTDDKYCRVGQCVSNRRSAKATSNTRYCCCYGDLCNGNMSDIYDPSQHTTEDPLLPSMN